MFYLGYGHSKEHRCSNKEQNTYSKTSSVLMLLIVQCNGKDVKDVRETK